LKVTQNDNGKKFKRNLEKEYLNILVNEMDENDHVIFFMLVINDKSHAD